MPGTFVATGPGWPQEQEIGSWIVLAVCQRHAIMPSHDVIKSAFLRFATPTQHSDCTIYLLTPLLALFREVIPNLFKIRKQKMLHCSLSYPQINHWPIQFCAKLHFLLCCSFYSVYYLFYFCLIFRICKITSCKTRHFTRRFHIH